MTINDINTKTIEGRLLFAALTILTTSESVNIKGRAIQGKKTEPDEMLGYIDDLNKTLFKDVDPIILPDESVVVTQKTFLGELGTVLNRYSKENLSDTPDFVLAQFLNNVLSAYGDAVKKRDKWFGVDMWAHKKGETKTIDTTRNDSAGAGHSDQTVSVTRDVHTPQPIPDAKEQINNPK